MRISDWSSDVCSSDLQGWRVANEAVGPECRHADVVHDGDARAHEETRGGEAPGMQAAEGGDENTEAHHEDADQRGDQGPADIVSDRDGSLHREHAAEVHGPDADAQGKRRGGEQPPSTGSRPPTRTVPEWPAAHPRHPAG